jgi:phosphodiesterase/alkaline phosphatase D-like protein
MTHVLIGPLVRATTTTEATIWAEFSQPCSVQLTVKPYNASESQAATIRVPTITIGGHYYAAPQITNLQPATWYTYHLNTTEQDQQPSQLQCFRTLTANTEQERPLRLIYGSCRKLSSLQQDTLAAFGKWLKEHEEMREALWPHLLLLIGDQIYADDPARKLRETYPQAQQQATSFEDFTHFYQYAWTYNEETRQALATIPTYMIFDDHDITNNWGSWPTWRAQAIQQGKEQLLINGLVAYWVYQGWGNLSSRDRQQHPLAQMMQAAAQGGQDIFEELRDYIRTTMYEQSDQGWHYQIPTTPPIFVTNTRADRSAIFPHNQKEMFAPTHIMSNQQMADLQHWMAENTAYPAIIVSSVPALLPPVIGLAEYLTGIRLWNKGIAPLHWLGQQLARIQLNFGQHLKFDHWPIYSTSWNELFQAAQNHSGTTFILSGDVHFSYVAEGRTLFSGAPKTRIYQLVSSPIQNELEADDQRLIAGQSIVTRMIYGRLAIRILPIQVTSPTVRNRHHLLFENTLAYITLQPDAERRYTLQQEYLGLVDGRLETIARITLPENVSIP